MAGPHPKEKFQFIMKTNVVKTNPVYPLRFSSWHAVKPNNWSFTRCWAAKAYLSMGCHYFIDTSHVFLIYNYSAIANQL